MNKQISTCNIYTHTYICILCTYLHCIQYTEVNKHAVIRNTRRHGLGDILAVVSEAPWMTGCIGAKTCQCLLPYLVTLSDNVPLKHEGPNTLNTLSMNEIKWNNFWATIQAVVPFSRFGLIQQSKSTMTTSEDHWRIQTTRCWMMLIGLVWFEAAVFGFLGPVSHGS